ncbi:bactofilin family protein [Hydrogenophaga luteola]|uniref:Polymer-forming cytoskeletal protein n=1 Tax=Hydrogenophaga luteola TaxID=1591122 RepID=A0ABV7WBJ1_9BURK
MKARRYIPPERHLEQHPGPQTMMNDQNSFPAMPNPEQAPASDMPQALEVDVGRAMPPAMAEAIPMLQAQDSSVSVIDATEAATARSMLADGMHFVGNALLKGPFSVAGQIDGNLTQAEGIQVSVVVTETGRVKGDITAHKISVMGHTDGVLDSGQGEVSLHDSASVHGLVRYGRIQVNGADLNATLERVAPARKVN